MSSSGVQAHFVVFVRHFCVAMFTDFVRNIFQLVAFFGGTGTHGRCVRSVMGARVGVLCEGEGCRGTIMKKVNRKSINYVIVHEYGGVGELRWVRFLLLFSVMFSS